MLHAREEQSRPSAAPLERLPLFWQRLLGRCLAGPNLFALARTQLPVLLVGETGTGKSTLAHALHEALAPSTPFVSLNASAIGSTLFLSEMFGHERGAFTGAHVAKRGLVAAADGGTLFLDEVGELSPECQAHLLVFLDSGRYRAVGGVREQTSNARIIAATNQDLEEAVRVGRFREDLYYRLASVIIAVPALRERPEDVGELAASLLAEAARRYGTEPPLLDESALDALTRCDWPGNVRQLRFVMERVAVTWPGERLDHTRIAPLLPGGASTPGRTRTTGRIRSLSDMERDAVRQALIESGGNRTRAAELLGISPRGLYNKIKKYALTFEV